MVERERERERVRKMRDNREFILFSFMVAIN